MSQRRLEDCRFVCEDYRGFLSTLRGAHERIDNNEWAAMGGKDNTRRDISYIYLSVNNNSFRRRERYGYKLFRAIKLIVL